MFWAGRPQALGGIISELYRRRKNLKKNFAPLLGESCVELISTWIHMTAPSTTTPVEFRFFRPYLIPTQYYH